MSGNTFEAYISNGIEMDFLKNESVCFLRKAENENRRSPFDLYSVYDGDTLVCVDTKEPLRIAEIWASKNLNNERGEKLSFYTDTKGMTLLAFGRENHDLMIEEACDAGEFNTDTPMSNFPRACCGDATDLIGEYFLNNGYTDIWYVCGMHYPNTGDDEADFEGKQSHAWISIGDPFDSDSLIVDITGDQFRFNPEFDFFDEPVYVGEMTDFHRSFEVEERDCHRFHGIKDCTGAYGRLLRLYNTVIRYL